MREVGKRLQNVKVTEKSRMVEQHGLKGHVTAGTGRREGKEVEWFCAVLGDGKGKDILTLGFYSSGLGGTYKAQLVKMVDSIQPNK